MGNKVIRCGFFLAKIKGVKPYGEIMLEWEAYFEPHILERGISYARNGAVQFISKQGDMIEAIVAGSEYYKVKLRFDGNILYDSYL